MCESNSKNKNNSNIYLVVAEVARLAKATEITFLELLRRFQVAVSTKIKRSLTVFVELALQFTFTFAHINTDNTGLDTITAIALDRGGLVVGGGLVVLVGSGLKRKITHTHTSLDAFSLHTEHLAPRGM